MSRRLAPARRTALALLAAAPLLAGCENGGVVDRLLPERSFTLSSTSMEPTLQRGSVVSAERVEPGEVVRGDILVVRGEDDEVRAVRLIGLPGETVELRGGLVAVNGTPAPQTPIGPYTVAGGDDADPFPPQTMTRLSETLPGAARAHQILDWRETEADDFGPVTLGADQYFLLGDNRDNAADSRFSPIMRGIGVVRGAAILRRVILPAEAQGR